MRPGEAGLKEGWREHTSGEAPRSPPRWERKPSESGEGGGLCSWRGWTDGQTQQQSALQSLPSLSSLAQAGLRSRAMCLELSPASALLQAPEAWWPYILGNPDESPGTRWEWGRK